jgi:anti-sigma B factor antagonist
MIERSELRVVEGDGERTLRLIGDLDLHTYEIAGEAIRPILADGGGEVRLDLSGLEFLDSSGVRVILEAFKALREKGHDLVLASPPPHVSRVFDILGLRAAGLTIEGGPSA